MFGNCEDDLGEGGAGRKGGGQKVRNIVRGTTTTESKKKGERGNDAGRKSRLKIPAIPTLRGKGKRGWEKKLEDQRVVAMVCAVGN